jgi:hypothetical protein
MNPISPSKTGAGPVNPSLASQAEKTPFLAAFGADEPFHDDSSPAPDLTHRDVPVQRDVHGLGELPGVEPHELARGESGGHEHVVRVVPPAAVEVRGVLQLDLCLVGERDGCDEVPAGAPFGLRHRQAGRDVVAGMSGLEPEVAVVEVQVAHHRPVDERGDVRGGAVSRAEDRRRARGDGACETSCRAAGLGVERAEPAAEAVDQALPDGVDGVPAEVVEAQGGRPGTEVVGDHGRPGRLIGMRASGTWCWPACMSRSRSDPWLIGRGNEIFTTLSDGIRNIWTVLSSTR